MSEIIKTKRLNKVTKKAIIETLANKSMIISSVGTVSLYCLVVKDNNGNEVIKYNHTKDTDTINVGKEIVAIASPDNLSDDIKDVKNALFNQLAFQQELKQIEFDKKHMMDYDIRALEFLKQYRAR